MFIIIIITIVAIALFLYLRNKKVDPQAAITNTLANIPEYSTEAAHYSRSIRIAGINYHSFKNVKEGFTFGYAKPQPTNPHDSKAIALYSHNNKLIGYIPRDRQDYFHTFSDPYTTLPFIAHFSSFQDYDRHVATGSITLIKGTQDTIHASLLQDLTNNLHRHKFL